MQRTSMKSVLSAAYGMRGVVKKTRYLYLVGQSNAEEQAIAEGLMAALGLERSELSDGANFFGRGRGVGL